MKQYGDIEEQKTWKHGYLFRVRVQGEPGASREILARGREELERLRDRWEVDFQTRKHQHQETENELLGYVAGDHEHLRGAQRRLESLGWEHDPAL